MRSYQLNREKGKTKTERLYAAIRRDIRSGELLAGEKLPSKRTLAELLGLSVMTVENAYALLVEEGYISARARSGYYVNKGQWIAKGAQDAQRQTGSIIKHLPEEKRTQTALLHIPGYARIMRRILSEQPAVLSMEAPPLGCAVLRNAIADYLWRYRNMAVQPKNIVIGSGAEYLYGLVVQLLGRDKVYGIEHPSYPRIEQAYRAGGARVARLKMGTDGIPDASLSKTKASVLHVTPFHSFPTNVTASADRRHAYIRWAREKDAVIIEDDFASEFSFHRRPLEPLYALDGGQRVIYMNTFSQSIAPSIRISYMVLPEKLLAVYQETLGFYACTVPVLDQYVLATFIAEGGFERQLARKRRRMREKG